MNMQKMKDFLKLHWPGLAISVAIPLIAGFVSSLISGNTGEIYKTLALPPASPPGWAFPVAWSVLYVCMGAASYIIFISDAPKREKIIALSVYAIQLALNFSWSIVFFRFRAFGAAVIVSMLLTLTVSLMAALFYRVSKGAGLIIFAYIIWLIFALYLSTGIFVLN
jgi:tryptophan-rich sensory protein